MAIAAMLAKSMAGSSSCFSKSRPSMRSRQSTPVTLPRTLSGTMIEACGSSSSVPGTWATRESWAMSLTSWAWLWRATQPLTPSSSDMRNANICSAFRMSLDEGVSGWVARHNQAQLVNDMAHDSRVAQVPGTEEEEPQATIIVPLNVRGKVTGVLCLDRMDGRLFEEHELEPAMLFANMAAIAIQNARTYEEMERQAISDGLTGLHNYRHFQETLKAEVRRAERYGETFCLLMMDLDHFKSVNDTIGHQKGDEVLRAVSDVLRVCSRESDYLARYGGEEFVIILPRTALEEARTLAERIRASVAAID